VSKQPLAKVTGDLDAPRGPDVEHSVDVPRKWFGKFVEIELPRNLNCAECSGGGCDLCGRSGAISLRERQDEATSIRVSLPALPLETQAVCLRIPEEGGLSSEEDCGAGHLFLKVQLADSPSASVSLADVKQPQTREEERAEIAKRSMIMAALLIMTFFGMLRLSGWL